MKIDNSAAEAFTSCPALYQERYINGWTRKGAGGALEFGTRIHKLLEGHFALREPGVLGEDISLGDPLVEAEAQELFEAYKAQYPVEPFAVVDVERYFEVPLPSSPHILIGKMDVIYRDNESGRLGLMDHKTESRTSRANLPEVWAAKAQVGLYQWAAEQIYGEPFDSITLDVLTRRSPAGRLPPSFRRDSLQRTKAQQANAIRDIIYIADKITELESLQGMYPRFTKNCHNGGWRCEAYAAHVVGECQIVQLEPIVRDKYFEPVTPYLPT